MTRLVLTLLLSLLPISPVLAQTKTSPIEVKDCQPGSIGKIDNKGLVTCVPAPVTAQPKDCSPGFVSSLASDGTLNCLPGPTNVQPQDCSTLPGYVNKIASDGTVSCGAAPSAGVSVTANNTWTGTQSFTTVWGSIGNNGSAVTGTAYTFVSGDCGKTVVFNPSATVTATVPQAIVPPVRVCNIGMLVLSNNRVLVNGTAVTPVIPINENGYTGTIGKAGSYNGLWLSTVSGTPTAVFLGSGS